MDREDNSEITAEKREEDDMEQSSDLLARITYLDVRSSHRFDKKAIALLESVVEGFIYSWEPRETLEDED